MEHDKLNRCFKLTYEEVENIESMIKRATPMKPIIEGDAIREADTFCPNCKINVSLRPTRKPPFCYCCGQALDWFRK